CFQRSSHDWGFATRTGFEVSSSSTIRRPLARKDDPVSVTSTAASTIPSATLASVAPHENSTSALIFRCANTRRTNPTISVATRLPSRSSRHLTGERSGTHTTQREGFKETLEQKRLST